MLNSKKIISAALALSMVTAFPASVCSAETDSQPAMICSADSKISPRWTYTSFVGAGFLIKGEYGKCTGSYELYSNMKSTITVTLMESANSSSWTAVESVNKTNYVCNPSALSMTSTKKLRHGYYYCTYTQVQIYDSSNEAVETAGVFSSYEYYE